MVAQQQLSGTIVVIIIAMAVQVCIMLVIVVKRQIMRFALRNRRGPHTHIGQGGPKSLRREIDRRLDYVAQIRHEPAITSLEEVDHQTSLLKTGLRIAAIEEIQNLEYELACISPAFIRTPCGNLRSFLLSLINGPLRGIDHHLIHQVCDDYDHARHHFEEFGDEKFNTFQTRVGILRQRVEANRSATTFTMSNLASASPKEQPRKKDKKKKSKLPQLQESRALLITSTNSANCTSV